MDKIYKFIGEILLKLLMGSLMIAIIVAISGVMIEIHKEEIFAEAFESFHSLYDSREKELNETFGIIDKDDLDQWQWENVTTEI